jgi:hypothetical protein
MIILIFYLATFITEIKTGSTLQDCKSVALKFSNTCPGAPDLPGNWSVQASMKPVTVKCQCGSAPSYYECDLFHMLCVTCYLDDQDEVRMRVQASGLPNRCIGGQESDFRLIDFSVAFNPSTDPRKKIFAN